MSEPPSGREPRKDARQNREHILEAARQAFGSDGVDVSMDGIAKLAGVGPGTLYRHFPSKDALLATLLARHHQKLDQRRAIIEAENHTTGRALALWIEALGDWMQAYEGLPEPLRAACRIDSALTPTCLDVITTTEKMVRAAQADGHARPDITGRTVFLGALAIAWAGGATAADQTTQSVLREVLRAGWEKKRQ